jgi:hypothetical protein
MTPVKKAPIGFLIPHLASQDNKLYTALNTIDDNTENLVTTVNNLVKVVGVQQDNFYFWPGSDIYMPDLSNGTVHRVLLNRANTVISAPLNGTNLVPAGTIWFLDLLQDGSGGRTVSYSANYYSPVKSIILDGTANSRTVIPLMMFPGNVISLAGQFVTGIF